MRPFDAPLQILAPAKVNLTLHLCGQRADGYHLLDSLVVFPRIGDRVKVAPAEKLSLEVSGPFAAALAIQASPIALKDAAPEGTGLASAPNVHARRSAPAPTHGATIAAMDAGTRHADAGDASVAGQASADLATEQTPIKASGRADSCMAMDARIATGDADNLIVRAARALAAHHGREATIALF